jgi:hypothetical protein
MPAILQRFLESLARRDADDVAEWLDETPDAIQEMTTALAPHLAPLAEWLDEKPHARQEPLLFTLSGGRSRARTADLLGVNQTL